MNESLLAFAAVFVPGAVVLLILLCWGKRRSYKRRIPQLNVFPIKSCAGIELLEAPVTSAGIAGDREWMVVFESNLAFVTQREQPKMRLIQPSFDADALSLRLSAPGREDIHVPLAQSKQAVVKSKVWRSDVRGYDEGDEVAAWLSAFLGKAVRLIRMREDLKDRSPRDDPKHGPVLPEGESKDKVAYGDFAAYLLTNTASLDDLNAKLRKKNAAPVEMINFRSNIVFSGGRPWEEDRMGDFLVERVPGPPAGQARKELDSPAFRNSEALKQVAHLIAPELEKAGTGPMHFRRAKLCSRCVMATVEADGTYASSGEPLKTLKKVHRGWYEHIPKSAQSSPAAFFGLNVLQARPGWVRVGDRLRVQSWTKQPEIL